MLSGTPVFLLSSMGGATVLGRVARRRHRREAGATRALLADARRAAGEEPVALAAPQQRGRLWLAVGVVRACARVSGDAHFLVGRSVLVVEDNNVNRVVLTRMLATAQCIGRGRRQRRRGDREGERTSRSRSFSPTFTCQCWTASTPTKAIRCAAHGAAPAAVLHRRRDRRHVGAHARALQGGRHGRRACSSRSRLRRSLPASSPLMAARDESASSVTPPTTAASSVGRRSMSIGGSDGEGSNDSSIVNMIVRSDAAAAPEQAAAAAGDKPLLFVVEDDSVTQTVLNVSLGRHLKNWRWRLFGTCEAMLAALTPGRVRASARGAERHSPRPQAWTASTRARQLRGRRLRAARCC
jgi:hypothetical protein